MRVHREVDACQNGVSRFGRIRCQNETRLGVGGLSCQRRKEECQRRQA